MKIKLDEGAFLPERAHDADAGYDLRTPVCFSLDRGASVTIDTGVHMQIPPRHAGLLVAKSGLSATQGITSTGLIDSGYTGSVRVTLYNAGVAKAFFERGDKISQVVILPCLTPELETVKDLPSTERGDRGFGSTGR